MLAADNTPSGCNGMAAPWGFSTITQYRPQGVINGVEAKEIKGQIRAWKWLADENADKTKVFSLQLGDKINVLLYEMIDKYPDPANTAVWKAESYAWLALSATVSRAGALSLGLCSLLAIQTLIF